MGLEMTPKRTVRVVALTAVCSLLISSSGCGGCSGRQHPIFDAVRQGDADKVRMLLNADPSVLTARERVPPRGKNPLPTYTGWTPLHCAAEGGHVAVIDLLLERGADVNAANDAAGGQRPLHVAAQHGHAAAAARLLERGADVRAPIAGGETALHLAARQHHAAVVRLLLERGADANARTEQGATPLHLAAGPAAAQARNPADARAAAKETVTALLDRGADVNARDGGGATPLLRCVEAADPFPGQFEIAEALLAHRAAVNDAGGPGNWTPLHWAVHAAEQPERGELALVKLLLERGADPTARDVEGRTPLEVARSPHVKELLATKRPPG
jgi:ankyrin repeat protein